MLIFEYLLWFYYLFVGCISNVNVIVPSNINLKSSYSWLRFLTFQKLLLSNAETMFCRTQTIGIISALIT